MGNKSYRIRTDATTSDQQIKIKLDQHYDQLNVLSLTIKPSDTWDNKCSNFGVVVGRVSANKGFGIPNAKVSIFLPLTESDSYNPEIVSRYPYKTTSDKRDGIRYNLLPSKQQGPTHTPVGNFPTKEEILRDDLWIEIYQKYYRFTTRTNDSGDFMFYGVPIGTYIIHYDVDISDIGEASVLPFELIAQGKPEQDFNGPYKFKKSNDIDSLAQIVSTDKTISVQPFWGSADVCDVQITRSDFDLVEKNIELKSYALFMGSSVTDSENNLLNQRCKVKKHVGEQEQLQTIPGTIDILTLVDSDGDNVPDRVEFLNTSEAKINDKGVWAFLIELNGQKVIKDEFGNEIISPDASKGIVKNGYFRFKMAIGPNTDEDVQNRAKYIVPNNGVHEYAYLFNRSDSTYVEDNGTEHTIPGFNTLGDVDNTGVDSDGFYRCGPLFREFQRKKIYTVRNYIPRYIKNLAITNLEKTKNFLGFKSVDAQKAKTPIPYNRMNSDTGFIYNLICRLYSILIFIIASLNWVVYAVNLVIQTLNNVLGIITHFLNLILNPPCITILGQEYCLWDFGSVGPWTLPYINYVTYVCCSSCSEENCNCYIPFVDCYSQVNVCNSSSSIGGSKTLHRCNGSNVCATVCQQQQDGQVINGIPEDEVKKACRLNTQYGCDNLNNTNMNIGTLNHTENTYSMCSDSLKQCLLGEYACDTEDLTLEFYNAWITGVLYFVQIRYKQKSTAEGGLRKAKFCDADWDYNNNHYLQHPFKNDRYDTIINERDLFQIDSYQQLQVEAGLIKYWPRQTNPPLGTGGNNNPNNDYYKGQFDDIYYNARQMKRQLGFNQTPSIVDSNSGNILLATEIMNLGSYLLYDDPDNAPFFINQVPATTYKRPENLTSYFCFSCDGIVPNDGQSGIRLHEKVCEFGTDFNDEEELVRDVYSNTNVVYGLYVDESFHSGRTYVLSTNTVDNLNNDKVSLQYGNTPANNNPDLSYLFLGYELTNNTITPDSDSIYVNQRNGVWETKFSNTSDRYVKHQSNPYYMFYGLHPGRTAIDLVHNNFIPKNICNI